MAGNHGLRLPRSAQGSRPGCRAHPRDPRGHAGSDDAQLAQRLRDQGDPPTGTWLHGKPKIGASSSFKNAEEAQEFTQNNIDQRAPEIQTWLSGPPAVGDKEAFISTAPDGRVTGHSVSKQPIPGVAGTGFKYQGLEARAVEAHKTKTILRYDPSLIPPFSVLTSMPAV
ncbi:RNase A-like domain-containing protein [Streptomyces sp. NPDC006691]|uniref:RNase A-like domain-containing protein n=1 Tax=Streptomyces sp. NPDC006691 TaxID=3364757 RepID=UPI003675DEF6